MRQIIKSTFILIFTFFSAISYSQDNLDLAGLKSCELSLPITYKNDKEDLEIAKKYERKEIVMYRVAGKQNKVKQKVTGYLSYRVTDEGKTHVNFTEKQGVREIHHIPPFWDKKYHFYLAECIREE